MRARIASYSSPPPLPPPAAAAASAATAAATAKQEEHQDETMKITGTHVSRRSECCSVWSYQPPVDQQPGQTAVLPVLRKGIAYT